MVRLFWKIKLTKIVIVSVLLYILLFFQVHSSKSSALQITLKDFVLNRKKGTVCLSYSFEVHIATL